MTKEAEKRAAFEARLRDGGIVLRCEGRARGTKWPRVDHLGLIQVPAQTEHELPQFVTAPRVSFPRFCRRAACQEINAPRRTASPRAPSRILLNESLENRRRPSRLKPFVVDDTMESEPGGCRNSGPG